MKRQADRGFTLIELLVVIAIIAILAAILFPVFQSAKKAGQKSACASNLKQLGLAVHAYMGDFGDWEGMISARQSYWPFEEPNPAYGYQGSSGRDSALFRYLKNADVIKCPADHGKQYIENNDHAVRVKGKYTFAWSYTINNDAPRGPRFGSFRRQSKMPFWVEENTDQNILRPDGTRYGVINDLWFVGSDVTAVKHNSRANVCFLDGHVGELPGLLEMQNGRWPDGTYVFRDLTK